MPQHVYSLYGSPVHLVLEESYADAYNRAVDSWFSAQRRHHEYHEKPWDPSEPLNMDTSEQDIRAFNLMAKLFDVFKEMNGGGLEVNEEQCPSDRLVLVEKLDPWETRKDK